jgi:hypothetical protein
MPGNATTKWTRALENTRALTVKQPYAWLIVNGYKDVEIRKRPFRQFGPLLIHAGLKDTNLAKKEILWLSRRGIKLPREEQFERGGIVGVVDVVDCKDRVRSPWSVPGLYAWLLANPRRLPFRRCKGSQGFFTPTFE